MISPPPTARGRARSCSPISPDVRQLTSYSTLPMRWSRPKRLPGTPPSDPARRRAAKASARQRRDPAQPGQRAQLHRDTQPVVVAVEPAYPAQIVAGGDGTAVAEAVLLALEGGRLLTGQRGTRSRS